MQKITSVLDEITWSIGVFFLELVFSNRLFHQHQSYDFFRDFQEIIQETLNPRNGNGSVKQKVLQKIYQVVPQVVNAWKVGEHKYYFTRGDEWGWYRTS